mgnify:CR=1 FL=1
MTVKTLKNYFYGNPNVSVKRTTYIHEVDNDSETFIPCGYLQLEHETLDALVQDITLKDLGVEHFEIKDNVLNIFLD